MDEIIKMLRAVINGQSVLREEMIKGNVQHQAQINDVKRDLSQIEKRLTKRIDNLGLQIANLEDDTPTRSEHDALGRRVTRVEKKLAM